MIKEKFFERQFFKILLYRLDDEFGAVQLKDMRVITTLGVGGFGRVELVSLAGNQTRSFGKAQVKLDWSKSVTQKIINYYDLYSAKTNEKESGTSCIHNFTDSINLCLSFTGC